MNMPFKSASNSWKTEAIMLFALISLTGGIDDSVRLWDAAKVLEEQDTDNDTNVPSTLHVWVVLSVFRGKEHAKW